jgi:uncharacterized damage-inducible protein DinB
MSFSQTLLPEFDNEMKNTRALLTRVPENLWDYKPHPKSMSLGRLAGHIADLPSWGKMTIETEVLDLQPGQKPWIPSSTAELISKFDGNVEQTRQAVASASDPQWEVMWTFKVSGQTVMSMPRAAVMRNVVMNHLIHHRAQLGVYLRLNNLEIPGMYGPSADETFQPQTASGQKAD